MANEIKLKRGSGSDPSASDLVVGEVAVRTDNGTLFTKKDDGNVAEIGAAAGVSDGDKGDIVVSNSGSTFLIDSGVIDNANVASNAAIAGSKINPAFTSGYVSAIFSANDTDFSDNSAPGAVHGIFTNNSQSTNGVFSALSLSANNSSGTNQVASFTAQSVSGGTCPNVFITQRTSSNVQTTALSIDTNQNVSIPNGNLAVTGDVTITSSQPALSFIDDGQNPDYKLYNNNGALRLYDITNTADRLVVNTDGHVDVTGNLDVGAGLDVTGTITASGLAQFNDDVQFSSPGDNNALTWDKSEFTLEWRDNVKAAYGDSDDLLIYHSGSHSIINNSTGDLRIESDRIELLNNASSEFYITCTANGSVAAYHDNTKRIETTSSGASITGALDVDGTITCDDVVTAGALLHEGDTNTLVHFDANDQISLKTNGSTRLQVTNSGAAVTGVITSTGNLTITNGEPTINLTDSDANPDFQIKANTGHFYIVDATNSQTRFYIEPDGTANVNGNLNVGSGLDVTGAITSTGKVQAGDDVEVTVSSGDAFIVTKGGTNQGHLVKKADGTTVAAITNGGAVGGSVNDCAIFSSSGNVRILAGGNNISNDLILNVTTGGVGVTGNMSITGTVDGRDVASDGTKLDGIESGATADQSASEIVALIADQTIAPSTIDMEDDEKIKLGTGDDLEIFHNGSQNIIGNTATQLRIITDELRFRSATGSETYGQANVNGGFELHHNNVKKFETTSTGATITGDAIIDAVKVGAWSGGSTYKGIFHSSQSSSEYIIMNNDSHTFISASSGGSVYVRTGANDSTNQLIVSNGSSGLTWRGNTVFHAGNLDITSDTSPVLGGNLSTNGNNIGFADDDQAIFGNGSDLIIKHSGNQNIINGATGQNLEIQTNAFRLRNQADSESMIVANANDSVELYFDNVLKVKTQTDHINIGCNLSSNPFDYLRFGASLFGAADIAPHNAGSHTVGLSFRTDSTADTTINPTEAMRISANGNIGAPNGSNIYNASDSRFKQNVTTLDKGLSAINSLRPVSFNWVEGFCDEEKDTLYGFIAQEVQTVDTNLISQFAPGRTITIEETTIENALTVNEKFIIPMLVKAVQELTAKVTALES